MNDPIGQAILDYFKTGKSVDIIVNSNYTENEVIPSSYFFRSEKEMPETEIKALKHCKGKILDVGAAAGCHSLVLQKKGYNITALEISEMACQTMKDRGIQKVICADIFLYSERTFDTLLLLMNGTGIGGTLTGLKNLLLKLKLLLNEKGQILIDSSDIKYLFEEEDGSQWLDLANESYYGEMQYEIIYKKLKINFDWLFVDFNTLRNIAKETGFNCSLVDSGKHHDYLAKLTIP